MATVTRTLTPEQATAIRNFLIKSEYPVACEKAGRDLPEAEGMAAAFQVREPISIIESALALLGWEERVIAGEFTADEDDLRDWAVGAFDYARDDLGQRRGDRRLRDDLTDDRRFLDVMEALMPLIDSLDATGLEAA